MLSYAESFYSKLFPETEVVASEYKLIGITIN